MTSNSEFSLVEVESNAYNDCFSLPGSPAAQSLRNRSMRMATLAEFCDENEKPMITRTASDAKVPESSFSSMSDSFTATRFQRVDASATTDRDSEIYPFEEQHVSRSSYSQVAPFLVESDSGYYDDSFSPVSSPSAAVKRRALEVTSPMTESDGTEVEFITSPSHATTVADCHYRETELLQTMDRDERPQPPSAVTTAPVLEEIDSGYYNDSLSPLGSPSGSHHPALSDTNLVSSEPAEVGNDSKDRGESTEGSPTRAPETDPSAAKVAAAAAVNAATSHRSSRSIEGRRSDGERRLLLSNRRKTSISISLHDNTRPPYAGLDSSAAVPLPVPSIDCRVPTSPVTVIPSFVAPGGASASSPSRAKQQQQEQNKRFVESAAMVRSDGRREYLRCVRERMRFPVGAPSSPGGGTVLSTTMRRGSWSMEHRNTASSGGDRSPGSSPTHGRPRKDPASPISFQFSLNHTREQHDTAFSVSGAMGTGGGVVEEVSPPPRAQKSVSPPRPVPTGPTIHAVSSRSPMSATTKLHDGDGSRPLPSPPPPPPPPPPSYDGTSYPIPNYVQGTEKGHRASGITGRISGTRDSLSPEGTRSPCNKVHSGSRAGSLSVHGGLPSARYPPLSVQNPYTTNSSTDGSTVGSGTGIYPANNAHEDQVRASGTHTTTRRSSFTRDSLTADNKLSPTHQIPLHLLMSTQRRPDRSVLRRSSSPMPVTEQVTISGALERKGNAALAFVSKAPARGTHFEGKSAAVGGSIQSRNKNGGNNNYSGGGSAARRTPTRTHHRSISPLVIPQTRYERMYPPSNSHNPDAMRPLRKSDGDLAQSSTTNTRAARIPSKSGSNKGMGNISVPLPGTGGGVISRPISHITAVRTFDPVVKTITGAGIHLSPSRIAAAARSLSPARLASLTAAATRRSTSISPFAHHAPRQRRRSWTPSASAGQNVVNTAHATEKKKHEVRNFAPIRMR